MLLNLQNVYPYVIRNACFNLLSLVYILQGLCYYLFVVNSDRWVGSCNTLNDLCNKVCVPNKTEDLSLNVFNMITGINESKILTKHVSCKCECKFDIRKSNSNQNWNNNKCVKKIIFGIIIWIIIWRLYLKRLYFMQFWKW